MHPTHAVATLAFFLRRHLSYFVLLVLLPSLAFADDRGKLEGIVYDADGAVLPGAELSITSKELVVGPRTTTSDEYGIYFFEGLPQGTYKLKVSTPGFQTLTQTHIWVGPGTTPFNPKLQANPPPKVDPPKQEDITGKPYGRITGVIYTPDGAELPGVKVTLTSKSLIEPQYLISAEDGRFTFNTLPPGSYQLKAKGPGFKHYTKSGIPIVAGKSASLFIAMEFIDFEYSDVERIVVECYIIMKTKYSMQSTSFSDELTNNIPTLRTYQSVAAFAPGVLDFNRQNPNIGGGSFRNNRYLVDGFDMTDPVTLTSTIDVNFDAIQEIEVLTGGLDAEYNTFGGVINVVTESGSNDFELRGSFFVKNKTLSSQEQSSDNPLGGAVKGASLLTAPEGSSEASVVLSGPLIRDKLSYHAAVTHKTAVLPSVDATDFDTITSRLKLTYQPNSKNYLTFAGGAYPSFINSDLAGERTQGGYYANARLDSVLADNLLFKATAGFQRSFFDSPGRATFNETRDRFQNEVKLTLIKDKFWGSHEFSGGIQTAPTLFTRNETTFSAIEAGVYLQDEWKPTPFLTIKPGLRFDTFNSAKSDPGAREQILGYSGFGPRLGVALDPTKDGKTKITAFAGRFVEPGNLVLPSFASHDDVLLACDASLVEDPSTAFLFEECRPPVMREYSFIFERQVGDSTKVGLSGSFRHQSHLFEDDEANLIYDESGSNVIGALNGDTTQSLFRIRTPDEAYIDYKGIDLYVQGRPSERSWILASYTYSKTYGTKDEDSNTQFTSFMDNPRQNQLFEGFLPWHSPHVLKLGGSYEFDFGASIGAWYSYRSGVVFSELFVNDATGSLDRRAPRGVSAGVDPNDPSDDFTLAMPDVNQLDLRLQYSAKKATGQDLSVIFDLFNVFNATTPLAATELAGASFGQVTRRQEPFSLQLGVQYRY